jgi:hypothetical protein
VERRFYLHEYWISYSKLTQLEGVSSTVLTFDLNIISLGKSEGLNERIQLDGVSLESIHLSDHRMMSV